MKYVVLVGGAKHSGRNTFINFVRIAAQSKDKRTSVRCFDPMEHIRIAACELGWTYEDDDYTFLDNLKKLADVRYNFTLSSAVDVIEERARDGQQPYAWRSAAHPTVTKLQSPSTGKRELIFIFVSKPEDGYAIKERYVNDPDVTVLGVYIARCERVETHDKDLFPILIQNDYGLGTLMGQAEVFVNTHIYGSADKVVANESTDTSTSCGLAITRNK